MRITNGVPRFQGQKFHYPRVSPGDQSLTKSRRNSGLEIGSNLVPRARVTLVQRNWNEELWDKAFQITGFLLWGFNCAGASSRDKMESYFFMKGLRFLWKTEGQTENESQGRLCEEHGCTGCFADGISVRNSLIIPS